MEARERGNEIEDDDKGEDEGDKDGEVGEEEEEENEEERTNEEGVDRKETGSKEGEWEGGKSGLNQPSHTEGMDIGTTASDTQGNTVKESIELLDNTVEAITSTRETHEATVEAEKTSSEAPGAPCLEPAREQRTIDTPNPQQTVTEEDTQPENINTTAERELSLERTLQKQVVQQLRWTKVLRLIAKNLLLCKLQGKNHLPVILMHARGGKKQQM